MNQTVTILLDKLKGLHYLNASRARKSRLTRNSNLTQTPEQQFSRRLALAVSVALAIAIIIALTSSADAKMYKEKEKKIHVVHVPKPVYIKKPVPVYIEKKVPVYKIKPVFVPKPIIVKKKVPVPVIKKVHVIQKVKVPVIKKVPYPVPVKKIKVSGANCLAPTDSLARQLACDSNLQLFSRLRDQTGRQSPSLHQGEEAQGVQLLLSCRRME